MLELTPIPSFYIYDHLENTRVVYTPQIISSTQKEYTLEYLADYFPYGRVLRSFVNGEQERYLTTGHERDVESGLDNRGARFYDGDVGRFLSLDPLAADFASWSAYNFVLGNPIILVDSDGRAPDNIGVDADGNVVFDDKKNDGNLFLVNTGVESINSLEELKSNSTQLSKNHEWIGTEQQMIDYIVSQMNHVDNISPNMFVSENGGLNIGMGSRSKKSIGVSGIIRLGHDKSQINIKIASEFKMEISNIPGSKSSLFVNPYNTRSALVHEGRHIQQYTSIYHRTGGEITRFNIDYTSFDRYLEYDAIQFQKNHSTYQNTTKTFKRAMDSYQSKFPYGATAKRNFLKMLNSLYK